MRITARGMVWLVFAALIGVQNVTARGPDRLEIRLQATPAFPQVSGKAHFKDRGDEREFEVEVENLRSLAGQRLRVSVDGVLVGQPGVSHLGRSELNLDSDRRERVPAVRSGTRVEVRTVQNALVASGQF